MSLKDELKAKKDALAELKARIEADEVDVTEEVEEQVKAMQADIAAKTAEIAQAEKKTALLNVIGKSEKEETKMSEFKEFLEKAKAVDKNMKGWSVATHIKAATDVVTAPQIADVDRAVAPQPKRVAVADFFGNATISGNAITYFMQGAYDGTPAVTAQGAKKPQNSTSFEPTTLPLSKIAAYIKETDEILWDADFLETEVRNSLVYRVGVVEDNTIVTAIGGTNGILTATVGTDEALADGIISGIMAIKNASAYDASVVIMNPADFLAAMKAKDANKQYYGGGYFSGAYGNGAYGVPTAIWGVPVFTSSAVTSGTALVAAREAVKIWRKGGLDVKLYEQNEDDAIHNRVTLVAEERLAVAVTDLTGVCKVS